ncbi:MAG: ABC transporter transmembrane domain-containing protein, partial [Bacteroidota bacterium]
MLRNLLFCFRFDPAGMRKALTWEMLHSILLAAPSGILLIIIWELFKENPDTALIWRVIAVMGGLFVVQLFVANKALIQSNESIYRIATALRIAIGNKLQRLSMGYYKRRDPGDLASVALQDVANFEQIFGHSISNVAAAIFGTLALSTFLIVLDWRLGLTMTAAVLIVFPIAHFGQMLVRKYGRSLIDARTQTNSRFLEYIQGMQHAKAYGMTGRSFRTLDAALNALRIRSIRTEAIPGPVILSTGVVLELFFVLMVWMALYFLTGATLEPPILIAFMIVGYRLYEPLRILMVEYSILSFMNVSVDRIVELL